MERIIKLCIYTLILIVIFAGAISLISFIIRFEPLEIDEKIELIKEGNAVRGGETTQAAVVNEETAEKNENERERIRLSDSTALDAIQFLFASLSLQDVDQFIFTFNVETILLEYQSLDDHAKEQIKDSMNQLSRGNTISNIKFNQLKDNKFELKIGYEDDKEAKVTLQLDKTISINYESEPTFFNIITPVSDIIEQIETTIQ